MDSSSIIESYFPHLSDSQKKQFSQLGEIYADWNSKINVISRKDTEKLYLHHILHSLGIAKVHEFSSSDKVLDIGTGGGFPGLPLAIMFPDTNFTLIDSIGKKIRVVQEVAKTIELKNINTETVRAEMHRGKYNFIVSRAVAHISRFMEWTSGKFSKDDISDFSNGILYLKGGDLEEELSSIKKGYKIYNLSEFFKEDFFETKKVLYIPN